MEVFSFLSGFFYRIRYPLFFGTLLATLLAVYFTRFLPKQYVVTTTVFTGITSKASLDDLSSGADWNSANNAHDNIINLVKSKTTLQNISMALLAQALIYGDPDKDNHYITAEHYRRLIKIVPQDVLALVDKNSVEETVENFAKYRTEDRNNFIYAVFSWNHEHYSYLALSKIVVRRRETSDMIEIAYQCNDPGIAVNTVALLNEELKNRYEDLLLSTSNDVVKYFEEQLAIADRRLKETEDSLVRFNTRHKIINYEEQTKHLAALNNIYQSRYEEILLANRSSKALLAELESQMDTRVKLIKENETFLNALTEISSLNGKIAEIEIFGGTDQNAVLEQYKERLVQAEDKIKDITAQMDAYKHSKEGVAISDMVSQWLGALVKNEQSTAELKVMEERGRRIEELYEYYSPVGPNLDRMDRTVRVAEESYLTLLHHLGLAKLKQKNILLNSGTLQVVTQPEFPLLSVPRKRELYVMAAFVGAILFIVGLYLLMEMLDRTIRDKRRAEKLTSGKVVGILPDRRQSHYRGYSEDVLHIALYYLGNMLNHRLEEGKAMIVNVLSIDPGEGKTFVAERLQEYWQELGFSVRYLSCGEDFNPDPRQFLQASAICAFLPSGEPVPDIVIAEYRAVKEAPVPKGLLAEADVNLLVVNTQRAWRTCDQPLFDDLRRLSREGTLLICLNKASREAVEEVVGQLPPYTRLRNFIYRLFNFGITAKSS